MGSLERKLARRQNQQASKLIKKAMGSKLGLFSQLPDFCYGCNAPFNRKNKEQVFTWKVRVVETTQDIKLFCPRCMEAIGAKDRLKKTE